MDKKTWLGIILVGLAGQIAWTIENMYFNVFLYNTISTDPTYIALMVALSAITATVTTIVMGALSDRIRKRKVFISIGYFIWAITVFLFSFITPSHFKTILNAALAVVALDSIMTFFGSTANDAVFNAYLTESVENKNRAKVETVIQILPMASMLFVFGVMDPFTQKGEWAKFFSITAIIMAFSAVLSIFLLNKDKKTINDKKENYIDCLTYGFKPSTIKSNKMLYIALSAYAINSFAMQIFFPYLIIYIQNYLHFSNYALLLAIVLVVASTICVAGGKVIDKKGEIKSSFITIFIMALGLFLMYLSRSFIITTLSGIVMMSGYLLSISIISALIREYTPKGNEGGIQGIRMIFQVMLPMILGPFVGSIAIKGSKLTYMELGVLKTVPTPLIFLISSIVTLLCFIPLMNLRKMEKKDECLK